MCRFFDRTVGVEETVASEAPSIAIGPVFPNPSEGALSYRVDLLEASTVQVHVFDVRGRKVETLIDRELSAGTHNLSVDLNGSGEALPGGVYYLRLDAEGVQTSRQFVLAEIDISAGWDGSRVRIRPTYLAMNVTRYRADGVR